MTTSRLLAGLFGLVLVLCHHDPALAQESTTFLSGTGTDAAPCSRTSPCRTLQFAHDNTAANGTIVIVDAGHFGPVTITKSISVINDNSGTAGAMNGANASMAGAGQVVITATNTGVVTLRGLTLNGITERFFIGVLVTNAHQVNIERCLVIGDVAGGIVVTPSINGQMQTLSSSLNVKIEDTVVTGNGSGARIVSAPGVTVNASISRSSFQNNNGGGVRIDGTGGGTVTAWISDTVSSMNNGNGVLAISGPGTAAVHISGSVMAGNVAYGVQSNQTNGGLAAASVESSKIMNNAFGQVGAVGGGTLLTAGNNLSLGVPGTGFSGPIALQ